MAPEDKMAESIALDGRAVGDRVPLTVSRAALLDGGTDVRFRQLVHRMLAFSAHLEAVRSAFGAMIGLSGIQYTVLISIAHLQGGEGVSVKRVAQHLSLSGSFVTIVGGQLAKLDLIGKAVDPSDRRRVRLTVTHRGRALLAELAPVQREVNDLLFRPLDGADFKHLDAVYDELVRSGADAVKLVALAAGAHGLRPGVSALVDGQEVDP